MFRLKADYTLAKPVWWHCVQVRYAVILYNILGQHTCHDSVFVTHYIRMLCYLHVPGFTYEATVRPITLHAVSVECERAQEEWAHQHHIIVSWKVYVSLSCKTVTELLTVLVAGVGAGAFQSVEVLREHGQIRLGGTLVVLGVWWLLHHLLYLLYHLNRHTPKHVHSLFIFSQHWSLYINIVPPTHCCIVVHRVTLHILPYFVFLLPYHQHLHFNTTTGYQCLGRVLPI